MIDYVKKNYWKVVSTIMLIPIFLSLLGIIEIDLIVESTIILIGWIALATADILDRIERKNNE